MDEVRVGDFEQIVVVIGDIFDEIDLIVQEL